jgi:nitronate monooxygenase
MTLPLIIQGGMGVAVSGWRLARAVSAAGQLGVVSGTLLPVVLARRLQLGDTAGDLRAALAAFPDPALAQRVRERFFIPGGKAPDAPFAAVPMPSAAPSRAWTELTLAANFVEVWLAKQTHSGRVGLNLLEKIQTATLASLYGAMLAGVDVVLMGAGIPRAIPGVLDQFAAGLPAELPLDVTPGTATDSPPAAPVRQIFNPADYLAAPPATLRRPAFLAIVSSAALATTLARKASGRVDGFVIENNAAGGHNAPPRGGRAPGPDGQPVYGPRDEPELEKFRALGLPFWLAGERANPARLAEARALGASGVQIGTAFAFCEESGLDPALKSQACALSRTGAVKIFTDPAASPTGFPFKVLDLPGTLSEPETYAAHPRRCDLGYLRETFHRPDGQLAYRCPAEPTDDYAAKNGNPADTCGRKCLCNGLLAAIGLGQIRRPENPVDAPYVEPAIVTAGQETADIARFLAPDANGYTAREVLDHVLAPA